MAREINLVPDIKNEMILALKLRNLIFFLCIVVGAAGAGVALFFGIILGGQQLVVDGKESTLKVMSEKINSYSDLSDFLTIKDQLRQLKTIAEKKTVFSRTFGILGVMLPKGPDTITISKLKVDFTDKEPVLMLEAQANAGQEPRIDYNVLDAFKKSMPYLRYDQGRYVDRNGTDIPTYCIVETGENGATLVDSEKGIYAFWRINKEGCNVGGVKEEEADKSEELKNQYEYEEYNGERVVRIWRTPQFEEWFNKKRMGLDGDISGIEHFNSGCIKYRGEESGGKIKWLEENAECLLVPGGVEGISVIESSNGQDPSGELVLRFVASIKVNREAYNFATKHMLAIAPAGRYNVTDSYIQIQEMFSERAADCKDDDLKCKNNGKRSN